jgi:alanine racemase
MRPCRIEIDKDALLHNLSVVKQKAPNSKIVAMVKSNAYGHGAVEISTVLASNVDYLGVAAIDEALVLRKAGIVAPILLAEGFFSADELPAICHHKFSIVVHSLWQLTTLLEHPQKGLIDVWLKFDSGMHRLGFNKEGFAFAIERLLQAKWISQDIKLMTHYATADDGFHPKTLLQDMRFRELISDFPDFSTSFANSAMLLNSTRNQDAMGGYVRPGLMLYGCSPIANKSAAALNLRPVMTLKSEIISLRNCQAGESVGYGAVWSAPTDTLIATVAIGYGDGYPRHLGKQAYVMVEDQKCAIIGRISMDMLMIDVSKLKKPYIGQEVILWGQHLPIEEVATFSNTVNYDLLCRSGLHRLRSGFVSYPQKRILSDSIGLS